VGNQIARDYHSPLNALLHGVGRTHIAATGFPLGGIGEKFSWGKRSGWPWLSALCSHVGHDRNREGYPSRCGDQRDEHTKNFWGRPEWGAPKISSKVPSTWGRARAFLGGAAGVGRPWGCRASKRGPAMASFFRSMCGQIQRLGGGFGGRSGGYAMKEGCTRWPLDPPCGVADRYGSSCCGGGRPAESNRPALASLTPASAPALRVRDRP